MLAPLHQHGDLSVHLPMCDKYQNHMWWFKFSIEYVYITLRELILTFTSEISMVSFGDASTKVSMANTQGWAVETTPGFNQRF